MAVSGDDRQGLQERQDAFMEWSEALPKKPQEGTGQPEDQQSDMQTHEVPLPPPPTVVDPRPSTRVTTASWHQLCTTSTRDAKVGDGDWE
jgi:hypothetical protein